MLTKQQNTSLNIMISIRVTGLKDNTFSQKLVSQQTVQTIIHILLLVTKFTLMIWLVFNSLLLVTIFMLSRLIQQSSLQHLSSIHNTTVLSAGQFFATFKNKKLIRRQIW